MSYLYENAAGPFRKLAVLLVGASVCCLLGASPAPAAVLDVFGEPPAGDPSAFTGPFIGLDFADDLLATLPLSLEGAFEGSTHEAFGEHNAVPEDQLTSSNVPTDGRPSLLFGAVK